MFLNDEAMDAIEAILANPTWPVIFFNLENLPDNNIQLIKVTTAINYLFVPAFILMLCLDAMIIVTYFKFGNRLSKQLAK